MVRSSLQAKQEKWKLFASLLWCESIMLFSYDSSTFCFLLWKHCCIEITFRRWLSRVIHCDDSDVLLGWHFTTDYYGNYKLQPKWAERSNKTWFLVMDRVVTLRFFFIVTLMNRHQADRQKDLWMYRALFAAQVGMTLLTLKLRKSLSIEVAIL